MKTLTIYQEIALLQLSTKQACSDIISCCQAVVRTTKKLIRSCLWVKCTTTTTLAPTGVSRTVYPLDYNKNNPMSGFNNATQGWSRQAQDAIRDYYECEDDAYTREFVAESLARLKRVEQEIAMEELHRDALEILVKK